MANGALDYLTPRPHTIRGSGLETYLPGLGPTLGRASGKR